MNVSCIVCRMKMKVLTTTAHKSSGKARTVYRCTGCESCVEIIDDLDETKQELRELTLKMLELTEN